MKYIYAYLRKLLIKMFGNLIIVAPSGILKGSKWTLLPYSMYWRGNTEKEIDNLIIDNCRSGFVCYDFGAHFGVYTHLMSKLVGDKGHVYAFEPESYSFAKLKRHTKLNNLRNVTLFFQGLAEKEKNMSLKSSYLGDSTASFGSKQKRNYTVKLKLNTLDNLSKLGKIVPPNFIKIDIEGYASQALEGGYNLLSQSKPVLLISLHTKLEEQGCLRLLNKLNYKIFAQSDTKTIICKPIKKG